MPPFRQNGQGRNFYLLISLKNTNLVEDVEILLPVKFLRIPLSGFREEVENVSANQTPGRPSCFSDRPEKHKRGRGHWDLASCQVSLNSATVSEKKSKMSQPIRYSWNSLTRSLWDQRKYFELSEVRVKHQLWTKLFFSIGVGFSTFRVMVYISYDVDTLYSWFGAFWRMLEHEINNNYETLFIYYNNYSSNTTKTYKYCITQFQDIVYIITN